MKFALPRWRKVWMQVHWFAGITLGTVVMAIGLTGAVLSFREEILDALNPGGRHVAQQPGQAVLSPPQLLQAVRQAFGERPVGTLAVFAEPGAAARVIFAPRAGETRGDTVYLDPYSGAALPALKGAEFFEWTEGLHRWLLLPREPGRVATGVLAAGLLLLALSGLYLRWPKRIADWRAWFTVDPALTGRAFLRSLHLVLGTYALPMYVVFTATGLYWAFDAVRDRVDAWVGEVRPARQAAGSGVGPAAGSAPRARMTPRADAAAVDIAPAWEVFQARAGATGGWREVILRVPAGKSPTVLFTWLEADPEHERARNRMLVKLPDAALVQDERYRDKGRGARFVAAIYPLHMGTYFGLPGRIAMLLAALSLPLFGVTGWMLYLDRRRRKRVAAALRA